MKTLRRVAGFEKEQVNKLRLSEYGSAVGFEVKAPGILWNRSDDQALILGCFDQDKLVATMRIEMIFDEALLTQKIECPWTFPVTLKFPVMLLSKAATDKECRQFGFNALMRKKAIELALEWKVHFLIGTLVTGSSRMKTMEEMGYEFFENSLGWQSENYRSKDPVCVAVLDLTKHANRALDVLTARSQTAAEFVWGGEEPPLFRTEVVR